MRKKLAWIGILYFAEGLPFGIAYDVWPVYFRLHGVSLREIGFMSLLSLPWTLKLLWAPAVDRWGARQQWMVAALCTLGLSSLLLPTLEPSRPGTLVWGLMLAFTLASATQDIAIDAYAIDLAGPGEAGAINGVRVTAARLVLLLGGGGLITAAGFWGFGPLFLLTGVLFWALAFLAWASPRVPLPAERRTSPIRPVLAWLFRKEMLPVLAFTLLFKLGDSTLGRMVKPFWVDRGYSLEEIGVISVSLGTFLTIAGALLGGWFVSRFGVFAGLLWLGLLQMASNLGYVAVAALTLPRESIYLASAFESLTQGMGTAAFLSFLMGQCEKEHAATQYALLSATFALSRDLVGAFSGLGVEQLGYAAYFSVTTVLALPGLALLLPLRRLVSRPALS
ncbi:MAG: MFS transporter [Thermoanaerobaculum sp.]|nr:MFS transporter [Thermoanaerobaculum sp.]